MFGQNYVAKQELDKTTLRVVGGKPFYTIQGEGPFAGKPAVFLRLHGCPLRCYFCDTDFSNPTDPELLLGEVVSQIVQVVWTNESRCRLLVVTGGEPTRQNLSMLVKTMTLQGWTVQIETAGMFWQECLRDTVIVVSPKTPFIQPQIWDLAHAFKYVIKVGEVSHDDGLPLTNTQQEGGRAAPVARPRPGADVYLSPMDEGNPEANAANAALVAELAMKHGYRAGLQLHKYMGVP